MVEAGTFREDLLFRINTFEIVVPPLRQRVADIPGLVEHFVRRARPQTPPGATIAEPAVHELLAAHQWPGNVRELSNVIEHALVLCDELPLTVAHLPTRLGARPRPEAGSCPPPAVTSPAPAVACPTPTAAQPVVRRGVSLRELEMQAIVEGLERNQGNKVRTAEELGISLKTLYNKLHQMQDAALQDAAARPA